MARIETDIIVEVPVRTAYNQWTQFEEFPQFMEGVREVRQVDDRLLIWRAQIAGREYEWEAEIREQIPDTKIIWRSLTGVQTAGIVSFDDLGSERTRVHLEMSYSPDGLVDQVGDAMGLLQNRVGDDLVRFKRFIEDRGTETGGYREEIENPDVPGGHTRGHEHGTPGR